MILASQSPRRRELLAEAGFAFSAVASSFDESTVVADDPAELVMALAREKAAAVAREHPGEVVVGSDTVVALGDEVLGKPVDDADAARMLRALSGRAHTVHTGVAIVDGTSSDVFVSSTEVVFWDLTDEEIDSYVASGEPRDKAGAYGIQGLGRMLVKEIHGDYYTVVGLPVAWLARRLREHGVKPSAV